MLKKKRSQLKQVGSLYQELIDSVREMRWKFRHVSSQEYDGEIRQNLKRVNIRKEHKNTVYGCYVLAHEVGHMYDFLSGKYRGFFKPNLPFYKDSEKEKKEFAHQARLAERSAWKFGKKILDNHGLTNGSEWYLKKDYFNNEWLPEAIKTYLSDPLCNYSD